MTLPPEVIRSIPKSIVRPNLSYLLAIDMESAIWYYGKENAYNLIMKHLYKYEK